MAYLSKIWFWIVKLFDIRDILFFVGLAMLGYGLYLVSPWISFTACGVLLMLTGYLLRDK